MPGSAGAHSGSNGVEPDDRRIRAYLIFAGLVVLFFAIIIVTVTSIGGGTQEASSTAREAALRKLPPYWTVHRGETYSLIAQKTGLTVEELETFNPRVDPSAIVPGQRLKLRMHVPPKPKRLGPRVHTVRSGESFGSIAAKTGKSIDRLQQLNPRLRPATLQPGDRMRLR